jgi:pimeloyl-ACP methyl ester carboxylesterase
MTDAEYISMEKSTNVRSRYKGPRWLSLARTGNRALSVVAPAFAARLAERLFLTPPRRRRSATEAERLATARVRPMRAGGRRIVTWTWGAGPRVLLVHGWGGRGAQLGAFVEPFVSRGFSVVTFDAPGHGAADVGPVTIPEMAAALDEVARSSGPLAGLIAHSVGAVTATRALYAGLDVAAAVYIAPLADLVSAAVHFTETLGFSRAVRERMQRNIEVRLGLEWSAFDVTAMAPTLETPQLVIHDRGDTEVPWQHGMAITRAWRGAEMLMTDGLGHRRILHAPDVVAAAVRFVTRYTAERRTSRVAADTVESLPALAFSRRS